MIGSELSFSLKRDSGAYSSVLCERMRVLWFGLDHRISTARRVAFWAGDSLDRICMGFDCHTQINIMAPRISQILWEEELDSYAHTTALLDSHLQRQ